MKKPALSDLQRSAGETRRMRSAKINPQNIKITINIDTDSMTRLREISEQSGVPYQRLLNKFLKEGLEKNSAMESRLTKLETELEKLKRKVAA